MSGLLAARQGRACCRHAKALSAVPHVRRWYSLIAVQEHIVAVPRRTVASFTACHPTSHRLRNRTRSLLT